METAVEVFPPILSKFAVPSTARSRPSTAPRSRASLPVSRGTISRARISMDAASPPAA
ncbi:MAG: hypothetical protein RBT20_13245 [Syntrophales bacterium]|nr:hypothetical protein [Syntrophales bacterium]